MDEYGSVMIFKIKVLVFCITFPPTSKNGFSFAQQIQSLCCSLVCNMSFNLMKGILGFVIDSKNYEIFFCKFRKINELYQLYQHSYAKKH